jgi:hypothetical protein
VSSSLPTHPRLAVDDAMWAVLTDAGYPGGQLVAIGGLGRSAGPRSWTDCVFVLGRDAALLAAAPTDPARQAREHSAAVAGWGVGATRIDARRVLVDPATVLTQAVRDARSRTEAGTALAGNPRLMLAPMAAVLLRRGDVDARVIAVLAAVGAVHSLEIATFPAVGGEDDRLPRRQFAVTAIDGQPVSVAATSTDLLRRWLAAQQPPYRPAATPLGTDGGRPALLVRYDAVGQPGLLPP